MRLDSRKELEVTRLQGGCDLPVNCPQVRFDVFVWTMNQYKCLLKANITLDRTSTIYDQIFNDVVIKSGLIVSHSRPIFFASLIPIRRTTSLPAARCWSFQTFITISAITQGMCCYLLCFSYTKYVKLNGGVVSECLFYFPTCWTDLKHISYCAVYTKRFWVN
jgi:hypothetical protein